MGLSTASGTAVWPHQVAGGKYVRLLDTFLKELRSEESHGNRKVFLDDVFVAHLLAFFNPSIRSLRTLEDFSQTRQAQKHLSIRKLCKSTLSDFHRLADPQRLQPLIESLRLKIDGKSGSQAEGLDQILAKTVAVDGTFVPAVAEVAWAVRCSNQRNCQRHRARIDCRIHVDSWIPEAIVVPDPGQSESATAAEHVQPGKVYLYDRAYSSFALINAHYSLGQQQPEADSRFVIRYRPAGGNSPKLQDGVENELKLTDVQCGVISDRVGSFQSSKPSRHQLASVTLREVIVEVREEGESKTIRLITNLLDVDAATIARLYQHRWQVELFFRWLKCFGNFNHLISHTREGTRLSFYVTIIAVMLMYLHTGFRPSKYMFAMMSQVASGGATFKEIMPILRERERRCELARQSQRRRLKRLSQSK